jgi:transcriptional regulator with XRE-family HTH domain
VDVEHPPVELGTRLRELREEKGLGLREVAKKAGVNHGYLSQLERGEVTAPAPSILQRIAPAYGVPFPVLMDWAGYIESGLSANQQRALSYLGDEVSDTELGLVRAFLDAIRKQGATLPQLARLDAELPDEEIARIRSYVLALLRRADVVDLVPTPFDQVLEVARLVSTGEIRLEPEEKRKLRERFGGLVDRVWTRLQGVIHFGAREIWINPEMYAMRQRFVLGHEVGHYVLPEHREIFAYLDDESRLRPDVHDLFERQANQAAIELLAQGDRLRHEADDSPLTMDVVDALADRFAISLQAAARRIVEETKQDCALAISFRASPAAPLTPPHLYCSRSFEQRFRWKATGCASQVVAHIVGAARRTQSHEPLVTTDVGGCAAAVDVDPLSTPRAVLVLFRALPAKSPLARLASIR